MVSALDKGGRYYYYYWHPPTYKFRNQGVFGAEHPPCLIVRIVKKLPLHGRAEFKLQLAQGLGQHIISVPFANSRAQFSLN